MSALLSCSYTAPKPWTLMVNLSLLAFFTLPIKSLYWHHMSYSLPFINSPIPNVLVYAHRSRSIIHTYYILECYQYAFSIAALMDFRFLCSTLLSFLSIKTEILEIQKWAQRAGCYAWLIGGIQELRKRYLNLKKWWQFVDSKNHGAPFTKCPPTPPWLVLQAECLWLLPLPMQIHMVKP